MKTLSNKKLAKKIAEKLYTASSADERKKTIKLLSAYIISEKLADELDSLLNDIALQLEELTGTTQANVKSRFPLSASLRKQIKELVSTETGANSVVLAEEIDESLIGGITVSSPRFEIDISLDSVLKNFKMMSTQSSRNYNYQETGGIQ